MSIEGYFLSSSKNPKDFNVFTFYTKTHGITNICAYPGDRLFSKLKTIVPIVDRCLLDIQKGKVFNFAKSLVVEPSTTIYSTYTEIYFLQKWGKLLSCLLRESDLSDDFWDALSIVNFKTPENTLESLANLFQSLGFIDSDDFVSKQIKNTDQDKIFEELAYQILGWENGIL